MSSPGKNRNRQLRAGIYCRVSHDPQGRGTSVAEQEKENRNVCDTNGWSVAWVVIDNDLSASRHAKKDRPGYTTVQQNLAGTDPVDVLVCWESSRAQRDLAIYVQVRDLCARHSVLWSYSGRVFDLTRTDDRFTTGLDALLAERYADETRDRVLRSVRSRMEQGLPHGKVLYGYTPLYDPATGNPAGREVEPEQARVVQEIFRRVLAGDALYKIAADLKTHGVISPPAARAQRRGGDGGEKPWTQGMVRRVALTPTYAGLRAHHGIVVGEGTWPAIVDVEDYMAATRKLTDPARKTWRESAPNLMSGIAVCGVCGGVLRLRRNRSQRAYQCTDNFCVSIEKHTFEGHIAQVLQRRWENPAYRETLITQQDSGDTVALAREELAALESRMEGFYLSAESQDGISAATLSRMEAKYLPQIEAARARAFPTSMPASVRDWVSSSDPGTAWEAMPVNRRRQVIRSLMRVRLLPAARRGERVFDPRRVEVDWL